MLPTDVIPFQHYTFGYITGYVKSQADREKGAKKCMQYVGVYKVRTRGVFQKAGLTYHLLNPELSVDQPKPCLLEVRWFQKQVQE